VKKKRARNMALLVLITSFNHQTSLTKIFFSLAQFSRHYYLHISKFYFYFKKSRNFLSHLYFFWIWIPWRMKQWKVSWCLMLEILLKLIKSPKNVFLLLHLKSSLSYQYITIFILLSLIKVKKKNFCIFPQIQKLFSTRGEKFLSVKQSLNFEKPL
jgi:hypothetical protein